MKKTIVSYFAILGVLGIAAVYLLLTNLQTDLPKLAEARQKVTEMQNVQSRIEQLVLIGQLQSVSPNSSINDEVARLKRIGDELQSLATRKKASTRDAINPFLERMVEEYRREESAIERLMTLDAAYRNSLAYIELTSQRLVELASKGHDQSLTWDVLILRSQIAAMWSNRSIQKQITDGFTSRLRPLEKHEVSEEMKTQLDALQAHALKAIEVEPKMAKLIEGILASPLVDSLSAIDDAYSNAILAETTDVQFATKAFATLVAALIAFVVSLMWELSRQAKLLDETNQSLESKVKVEAAKIHEVEQALFQARKLESIGVLAAGIAHEINTPMQCVTSNVEFLSNFQNRLVAVVDRLREQLFEDVPKPREERIEEMQSFIKSVRFDRICDQAADAIKESAIASQRVVEIVRAMKCMSHPGTANKQLTNINELLKSAAMISRSYWKEHAELDFQLAESLPGVYCYSSEVSQVMLNLIVNAADAIAERNRSESRSIGRIRVSTLLENDGIRIEINDDGAGIPDDIKYRVFDQFFTTKEVGKGTGQGLAITHEVIISRHSGRISLDSTVGKGTSFIIWIPCDSKVPCAI